MEKEKRLPGVYPQKMKNGELSYRASLTYKRKHISLGSFPSMIKAHAAYLEATMIIKDKGVSLSDYTSHRILAHHKWVVLLNFRDNGFYFNTPIYTRQKHFEYHLAPTMVLKFDIDDLFYYSTRTIMKRGGHFFVSDYGMQVNILGRYGIKNYGVKNRDYRFVNGDEHDFRYENIEIINRYNGVQRLTKRGKHSYRTRIHIRGNYTVGVYESEAEAAIAYNKAIDILHKAGVKKKYVANYLEEVTAKRYAEIYAEIKISPRVLAYTPHRAV
jgi:hypothetical protein